MSRSGAESTMSPPTNLPPLRLDAENALAQLGTRKLHLSPRAFAVLHHLVTRAGALVEKRELHRVVWRGAIVGDGALVVCIRELRKALGDSARDPCYIETVHRRGYRYIGPVGAETGPFNDRGAIRSASGNRVIGRTRELAALAVCRARALRGEKQLVFVSGEPGIGKTTVVNASLEPPAATPPGDDVPHTRQPPSLSPLVARGQCIEMHGAIEPYMPLLEVLDGLCRGPEGGYVIDLLEREAPNWLLQLPGVVPAERQANLLQRTKGSSQARMLRELANAFGQMSGDRLLTVVLEDLHWSDPSTINAVSILARRTDSARLLLIGTFRPADMHARGQPWSNVVSGLHARGECEEIRLGGWDSDTIAEYLDALGSEGDNQPGSACPDVIRFIEQRTEGNPLFVSVIVDDLIETGCLKKDAEGWRVAGEVGHFRRRIPAAIGAFLTQQGDRLQPGTRALLEAASVTGVAFSAATVAAALQRDVHSVEQELERLAAYGLFVERAGVSAWPDGTLSARYSFLHALYQQSWHDRMSPLTLQTYNQRIGLRKECGWRESADDIATELAGHFMDGRDFPRAVRYLCMAGINAARRSAHQEAIGLLSLGLELLSRLPSDQARDHVELNFHTAIGPVFMASRGYAAPEVEQTYATARSLSVKIGATPQHFVSLYGLWSFYLVRPRHRQALSLADRLLELATLQGNVEWQIEACWAKGCSSFMFGDLGTANGYFARCVSLYESAEFTQLAFEYGHDPGVSALGFGAVALWQMGLLDQAFANSERALAIARDLNHPFSLAYAQTFGAWLHVLAHRFDESYVLATLGANQCAGYELPQLRAMCEIIRRIARMHVHHDFVLEETHVDHHVDEYRRFGGECLVPLFLTLSAEAYAVHGQHDRGMAAIEQATEIMERNEEFWCKSELLRIRAKLRLLTDDPDAGALAAQDLAEALRTAEVQGSYLPALRAAMDSVELTERQGADKPAHAQLHAVIAAFSEGFGSIDLGRAESLLASCGSDVHAIRSSEDKRSTAP